MSKDVTIYAGTEAIYHPNVFLILLVYICVLSPNGNESNAVFSNASHDSATNGRLPTISAVINSDWIRYKRWVVIPMDKTLHPTLKCR